MNTLKLNAQKIEFVKEFLNENNPEILEKVITYFKTTKKMEPTGAPCQFTSEEIREIALRSIEDAKQGLGKSLEEVMAEPYFP